MEKRRVSVFYNKSAFNAKEGGRMFQVKRQTQIY